MLPDEVCDIGGGGATCDAGVACEGVGVPGPGIGTEGFRGDIGMPLWGGICPPGACGCCGGI